MLHKSIAYCLVMLQPGENQSVVSQKLIKIGYLPLGLRIGRIYRYDIGIDTFFLIFDISYDTSLKEERPKQYFILYIYTY